MESVPRSKLRPPRLGAGRVERPRLFSQLDRGLQGQFTLVAAPAGYGKTTLLAQWVQRQEMPTVWLWLEEADDDPEFFLHALVSAFRTAIPDCCPNLHSLLARAGLPSIELLARELGNDLDKVDDFLLVLDDVQNVKDHRILEILRSLVYRPPSSLHLVLSCRADPLLPLGALRGRGLLNELRAADLRFNEEEAVEYLGQVFGRPLDDSLVTSLVDRTEGWIAGLHLAALSLLGREDLENGIREFGGSDRYIADYLIEELLTRLDPALQRYLMSTSILERLSRPLCRAVMGEENVETMEGRPVLEWLEQSNLFTISLDEQREWFRYHHLFRDLLRHRLQMALPADGVAALQLRAGEWLAEAGKVDLALEHFAKARRPDLMADTVERHRRKAIDDESWRTLARWVGRLDQAVVRERPSLVLIYAWLAHERADRVETSVHCDLAEQLLDLQQPGSGDSVLRGEISALRAEVSYFQGDGDDCLRHAREALSRLPREHRYPWAIAVIFEGGALQMLGDTPAALDVFHRASLYEYGGRVDPRVLVGMALAGFIAAELDHPRQAAERMLSQATGLELEDTPSWGNFLLGMALYLRNDLSGAEARFALVEPYTPNIVPAKQSAYGLAWIRQARGRLNEALQLLDTLDTVTSDLGSALGPEIRLLKARLAVLSGSATRDLAFARSFVSTVGTGPGGLGVFFESSPISALVVLLLAGGSDDLAVCEQAAERLLARAQANHNTFRSIQCLILRALILDRRGEEADALASLDQAVTLAAGGRLVRLFPEMGPAVRSLLERLRERRPDDSFMEELLASFFPTPLLSTASGARLAAPAQTASAVEAMLTNRELDVLELLAKRLSNKEIARELFISPATVKRHTLSIYAKLAVGGRREAVARAQALGLLRSSG